MLTGLVMLFVIIGIICVAAWGTITIFPVPANVEKIIWVIAIVVILLVVLQAFNLIPNQIPRLR